MKKARFLTRGWIALCGLCLPLFFSAFSLSPPPTHSGPQLSPGFKLLLHSESLLQPLRPFLHWKTPQQRNVRILLEWTSSYSHRWSMESLGMEVTGEMGAFATGWLPVGKARELSRLTGLKAVELSRRLRPHLNVSAPLIAAPQTRLKYGLDGRGVILGIIDTGLDYTHPAFRKKDGTTRLLALVDYSIPDKDNPDKGKTFSPSVFLPSQINKALADNKPLAHKDTIGHGTHITGIAAGNGGSEIGVTGRYLGIAPRADILAIKATRKGRGDFDSGDVLESIGFIHRWARKVKKPYVINISLGGHQGGHDGTSILERAIDSFSGTGKKGQSVVVSAGNEGSQKMHASGWLSPGTTTDLKVLIPKPGDDQSDHGKASVQIELWVPHHSALLVEVLDPEKRNTTSLKLRDDEPAAVSTEKGNVTLLAGRQTRFPFSRFFVILLSGTKEKGLHAGEWTLRLSGSTPRFDAWIAEDSLRKVSAKFVSHHTQEMLIGVPGSARGGITVGSFNSRVGWFNVYDETVQRKLPLGQISSFSSPGPTRDGRFKPEVVAPGLFIASALSSSLSDLSASVVSDGPYIVSQGTSQAAPHVAGGVAMLLQWKPDLDTPEIRRILKLSASSPASSLLSKKQGIYHHQWGFGKLQLLLAAQILKGEFGKNVDPNRSTVGSLLTQLPADGSTRTRLVAIPRDANGLPLPPGQKVVFTSTRGSITTSAFERTPGLYEVDLRSPPEPGATEIRVKVNGVTLKKTLHLTFTPSAEPPEEGCSCQTTSTEIPIWGMLLLLVLAGFRKRRRKPDNI